MIYFLKKNKLLSPYFPIIKDIHAHLIPGIDDGPASMEESIEMITKLQQIGYQKLIATPHVFTDFYPNSSTTILNKFQTLKQALKEAAIEIDISVSAEYFLDHSFMERLAIRDLLPLDNQQHLLIEMSTFGPSMNIKEVICQIKEKKYKPILAHPERYLYLKDEDYLQLIQLGCEFQINLLSINGFYGKPVQQRVLKLINKNWVRYMATDAHNLDQVQQVAHLIQDSPMKSLAQKVFAAFY